MRMLKAHSNENLILLDILIDVWKKYDNFPCLECQILKNHFPSGIFGLSSSKFK